MTAPAVLVVEDDPGLRVLIARALQQNGFAVFQASTGAEMWNSLEQRPVDLIILDVMLPGKNGIDLCREIRTRSDVPIIFVSAKVDETDRVIGLELGADDYIPKPFGTRELIARVRAVLRRRPVESGSNGASPERVQFAGWAVDMRRRSVFSPSGASIELTGAEFDLLASFIGSPQRVLGRERLIELSRVRLGDSSDRSIDVLVSRLRRKLSSAGQSAPIVTVRGVGYMLTADVTHG
ncbi:MAG TPA: response regulator transcription factor [Steroidobacter sp.]|uniref:response regulator transcription factor n=1 Tax=Steroidobacter sp. TaxID=1978227 RepID=UPI002EDB30F1